jgi:hypothetical protein
LASLIIVIIMSHNDTKQCTTIKFAQTAFS